MNTKQTLKNLHYLLLVVLITIALPSCSKNEDGEEDKPVSTYNLNLESTSNDLAQDGTVTIKFTVEPAGIEIASAQIRIKGEDNKESPIEVTGLSEDNGIWKVQAKVTDFTRIKANQTVKLTTLQKKGTQADVEFTLNDPYAINDKYSIKHPYSISYCRTDNNQIMGLPIIITAAKAEDLAIVDNADIKITNSSVTTGIPANGFMFTPIKDEKGILLAPKPETVKKLLETPAATSIVSLYVWITGANGRSAHFPLNYILSSPRQTVTDENLAVSVSDLHTSGFSKTVTVDVRAKFKRLGIVEKDDIVIVGDLTGEEIGLHDANNNPAEENFMIAIQNIQDIYSYNVTFAYDPDNNTYTAGSYNYIVRYTWNWKYNGKTYPRICGDLQYAVTLED